jgi:hypothetical protein
MRYGVLRADTFKPWNLRSPEGNRKACEWQLLPGGGVAGVVVGMDVIREQPAKKPLEA